MRRALVLTLLAACQSGQSEERPSGRPARLPTPVEVVVARVDTMTDGITATGAIEAVQSIELRPEVEGRLVEILVTEGVEVADGTPLFRVDDAERKALVARLEAERDLARQAVERARELISMDALTRAEMEQAEASVRSSQAQLDLEQLRLDRTTVRAPFAGVVGARLVSIGDYVDKSSRLTTLHTVDPQRAVFQVPERYAPRLRDGQRVVFQVAAVNREFTGVVDFVDPMVQLPGRTVTVKAEVRNPNRLLWPGMFIEVRLALEVRPNATVIPEDAILPVEGATYVWVVSSDVASRREVHLGIRTPGFVEIRAGVDPGDQVVVGGLERLTEGAPVRARIIER